MNYLIVEMMTYLLGVAILGIIVGWLFTRASYSRKIEDCEVNLLSRLHDVEKELDISRQQLNQSIDLLEEERANSVDKEEAEQLRAKLEIHEQQSNYSREQIQSLNQTLDNVTTELRNAKSELTRAKEENEKMQRDFDNIQNRLADFQDDITEITENSGRLRTAFDEARIQLVARDRRIAELESSSTQNIQLAAATNISSSEPELAISRIARLQARVEELFDEVTQKDQQINELKSTILEDHEDTQTNEENSPEPSETKNIEPISQNSSYSTEDDLTLIRGIDILLERRLNELGVHNLDEIAQWTDDDIERIDFELQNFPGRIQSERWIEQARELRNVGATQDNPGSRSGGTRH